MNDILECFLSYFSVLPSLSSVRSAEINIEKPSTNSIANRLNKFFNIRSTKDSLEERGILKCLYLIISIACV